MISFIKTRILGPSKAEDSDMWIRVDQLVLIQSATSLNRERNKRPEIKSIITIFGGISFMCSESGPDIMEKIKDAGLELPGGFEPDAA